MDNITFFNLLTLAVFEKLYAAFPTPIDLEPWKIAMEVIPIGIDDEVTGNCLIASTDTVKFLEQEGFLTFLSVTLDNSVVYQAGLTLRGLAILGSTPKALDDKPADPAIIDQIKSTLAGGAKTVASEAIKHITQQVISAALRHAGGITF